VKDSGRGGGTYLQRKKKKKIADLLLIRGRRLQKGGTQRTPGEIGDAWEIGKGRGQCLHKRTSGDVIGWVLGNRDQPRTENVKRPEKGTADCSKKQGQHISRGDKGGKVT